MYNYIIVMLFPDVVFSKILSYISAPEICTVDIYVHLPRNHDFSNKRNYPFYDPKTVTIKDVKLQLSYHMNTISFLRLLMTYYMIIALLIFNIAEGFQ